MKTENENDAQEPVACMVGQAKGARLGWLGPHPAQQLRLFTFVAVAARLVPGRRRGRERDLHRGPLTRRLSLGAHARADRRRPLPGRLHRASGVARNRKTVRCRRRRDRDFRGAAMTKEQKT